MTMTAVHTRATSEDALRDLVKLKDGDLASAYHEVLDNLISTAYDPSISTGHRGVVVHTLCSILGRAKTLSVQRPVNESAWFRIFAVFLDRSDDVKSKIIRQLFLSLHSVLHTFPKAEVDIIVSRALDLLLEILLHLSDHVKVKPALQALSLFLSKGTCSVNLLVERLLTFRGSVAQGSLSSLDSKTHVIQWFLEILFDWVRDQHSSIPAGQAACVLVRCLKSVGSAENVHRPGEAAVWITPLVNSLRRSTEDLQNIRAHLLIDLFEGDFTNYLKLLEQLGLHQVLTQTSEKSEQTFVQSDDDYRVLFTCLEVGKELGFVSDHGGTSNAEVDIIAKHIRLGDATIRCVIEDARHSVRLSGLALIVASTSKKHPFSNGSLKHLRCNIPHLFFETDASARGEVLVFVQRLVDRIKTVLGVLHRALNHPTTSKTESATAETYSANPGAARAELFRHHITFLRWFLKFVSTQLYPSAAYQRHITGLRALIILIKSGLDGQVHSSHLSKQTQGMAGWSHHELIFEEGLTRLVQDLLMDPFDDVRNFAAAVLVMHPNAASVFESPEGHEYLCRAEDMMLSSGRADHADGVSRVNAIRFQVSESNAGLERVAGDARLGIVQFLVQQLEDTITLTSQDLGSAVSRRPIHGVLASLRFIVDTPHFYDQVVIDHFSRWHSIHERLIEQLHNVWRFVKSVLCVDAPEGYVPEDLEDDNNITTKDILSYCWRALKESSSLLRILVLKASTGGKQGQHLLSLAQFESLCWLVFTELVELRHRGAFSAVAQAFVTCCCRAQALDQKDLLHLLYTSTLSAIKAKGSATTRRSAGLPSLVVGILTACPGTPLFRQAMDDLMLEAQVATNPDAMHGDPLPQVHALNCLRSIFINTTLGPHTEPYLAPILSLAGQCLTCDVWAIRNCGLMLFRALIDRLLGSADVQELSNENSPDHKPRFSFSDFPSILDIVLDLLQPEAGRLISAQNALESVFPALKVLQRIPPPHDQRGKIRDLILRLCQSPHWHVRDMAARTYAGLVADVEILEIIQVLISPSYVSENAMHGRLLCALHLISRSLRAAQGQDDKLQRIENTYMEATRWLTDSVMNTYIRVLHADICNSILLTRLNGGPDLQASLFGDPLQPSWTRDMITTRTVMVEAASTRKSFALNCLLGPLQRLSYAEQCKDDKNHADIADAIADYLHDLAIEDLHTFCQVAASISEVVSDISLTAVHIISEILSHAAIDANDVQASTSCRTLLVDFYNKLDGDYTIFFPPLEPLSLRSSFQNAKCLPPSSVEATVLLWGPLLDAACLEKSSYHGLLQELKFLAATLRPLVHDSQPFDLRIAVARCISSIPRLWTLESHDQSDVLASIQTDFILLIYDLLNDDDEEIRGLATRVATQILCNGTPAQKKHDCVPLLASERLISHLSRRYSHLPSLRIEAILRMTGKDFDLDVDAAVTAASRQDTALFAVEKQNLFVDPVRETALWSHFLKTIPPRQMSSKDVRALCRYVNAAMKQLVEMLETEHSGPLGLTSRTEAFQFGMRVFSAVDVIATWQRKFTIDLPLDSGLMMQFTRLLELAKKKRASKLWIRKIESVICRDIREKLQRRRAGRRIKAVMKSLRSNVEQ